ncbi:hypothetical protein RclHR1_18130001 [Rhizophagus clarus]|uniref:Uncharacterized protein n=1 Tax=Rhizophagus clarus TaxID=94130 RepID=A0A2Z6QLN8_9GLOM|nr:hypothetical protein RclHR1_18130001 [Rhizophagus clarus]
MVFYNEDEEILEGWELIKGEVEIFKGRVFHKFKVNLKICSLGDSQLTIEDSQLNDDFIVHIDPSTLKENETEESKISKENDDKNRMEIENESNRTETDNEDIEKNNEEKGKI